MPHDHADLTRDPLIRAFGAVLRGHREAAGLSRPQLAEALGCSAQWIEKLETGQKPPSAATAADLDTYFKTPADAFHRMWKEIKRAGKHVALPPGFPAFVDAEARASVMHIFAAMLLHGLFQTEAYAREVLRTGRTAEETDELVRARLDRQEVLRRAEPPRIVLVVDEWAIHRPVGGAAVMREQLDHLVKLAEQPNVTLQIVPAATGAYAGLPGAFTMLRFDKEPDQVYVEGHTGGQLIGDPREVREYGLRYDLIRGSARSAAESLSLLRTLKETW